MVLRPLHQQGICQPVIAFLLGLEELILFPGLMSAQLVGTRFHHHTTLRAWIISLAVNGSFYLLLGFVCRALWKRTGRSVPAAGSSADAAIAPSQSPARTRYLTRRRFLARGTQVLGLGAAAGLGYSLLVEPRWFTVTHHDVPIQDLPPELDGIRLVQLTDIHHGPWLSIRYVRQIVRAANDQNADLVCLTGDYVHESQVYIEPVVAELARLQPRIATVAVLGNHDWWEDVEKMRRAFAQANIPLIDNDRRVLTPDRRLVYEAQTGLAICGVGDFWEDRQLDYRPALDGLPASMPRLLLSHNPDVAEEPGLKEPGRRVDLMLSGHTHGGQVRFPFFGAPVTNSMYGQRYARGLVRGPVCWVYTCRGIGVSGCPLRLGAFPEIAVFHLRAQAG
jgi:predicted MPP superfamily phosphohydrolase